MIVLTGPKGKPLWTSVPSRGEKEDVQWASGSLLFIKLNILSADE